MHRCARLRARCSGGRYRYFLETASAHALLLRSSWPATAKRLLDDPRGHLSLFPTTAPPSRRLARLCTTQQLWAQSCSTSSGFRARKPHDRINIHRSARLHSEKKFATGPDATTASSSIRASWRALLMMIFFEKNLSCLRLKLSILDWCSATFQEPTGYSIL